MRIQLGLGAPGAFATADGGPVLQITVTSDLQEFVPRGQLTASGAGAIGVRSPGGNDIFLSPQAFDGDADAPSYPSREGPWTNVCVFGPAGTGVELDPGARPCNSGTLVASSRSIPGDDGARTVSDTGELVGGVDLGGGGDSYRHRLGAGTPEREEPNDPAARPRSEPFAAAGAFRGFGTVEFRPGLNVVRAPGAVERAIVIDESLAPEAETVPLRPDVTVRVDGDGGHASLAGGRVVVAGSAPLVLDGGGTSRVPPRRRSTPTRRRCTPRESGTCRPASTRGSRPSRSPSRT
jgi:hypothetical protein